MFLERGFEFTHEAVREWEERFAPLLADQVRRKRKGKASKFWQVDETYIKVQGKWRYLYRATDDDGNLVDSMLSEKRDLEAAKAFFRRALAAVGATPERVTTDGHTAYPRAIREVLGPAVVHQVSPGLNSRMEQDHRGVKQRYYPMQGFGAFASAKQCCEAFDEVRGFFRARRFMTEPVSLSRRRQQFKGRMQQLRSAFQAA